MILQPPATRAACSGLAAQVPQEVLLANGEALGAQVAALQADAERLVAAYRLNAVVGR